MNVGIKRINTLPRLPAFIQLKTRLGVFNQDALALVGRTSVDKCPLNYFDWKFPGFDGGGSELFGRAPSIALCVYLPDGGDVVGSHGVSCFEVRRSQWRRGDNAVG